MSFASGSDNPSILFNSTDRSHSIRTHPMGTRFVKVYHIPHTLDELSLPLEDPFLLHGKKFSLGVYTALMGIDPLSVWLHREMLVLLCSHNFTEDSAAEPLAHLSNGLLNREQNPDKVTLTCSPSASNDAPLRPAARCPCSCFL